MRLGLDVGSSSVKLAAALELLEADGLRERFHSSTTFRVVPQAPGASTGAILVSDNRRSLGNPLQTALDLIGEFGGYFPDLEGGQVCVTGSGGRRVAEVLGASFANEFKAIARGVTAVCPQVRTVFEMGGENSKYILLDHAAAGSAEEGGAQPGILDYSVSAECAAGTGSFIDQQASRLQYRVEEIGNVVLQAKTAARIAGRCSVFAKSDMIHAQQKGYRTEEVLKGLCEAVARNFKSNIVKGKKVVPPVAFMGGVSQNAGVVQALAEAFRLSAGEILVPDLYAWMGAIGAALLEPPPRSKGAVFAADSSCAVVSPCTASACAVNVGRAGGSPAPHQPLSLDRVLLLRDHPEASRTDPLPEIGAEQLPVFLGIDIGSVSTNLAVLDEAGRLLHGIYLRTVGRPIEVVNQGLKEIEELFGGRIHVHGVGTTGSGRELIGELVGADTINDEITAHKSGAIFVHQKLVRSRAMARPADAAAIGDVDTIFEIGGQDSKYISLDHGVVVDFAMNEACAAGTGSFLEEQAERLGIQIKNEFARLALGSAAPASLGERCTVFMERDVNFALQRGATVEDLTAGLAYSVALNYLNRVVRGRKVGEVIYFQGGTAYNDAVAAAFSHILGKRIIVPPHNGIIGAIGMALIARDVNAARRRSRPSRNHGISTFRGFDLNRTDFSTREFVCKACSNYCDMKEVTIEGQKTYWGDRCSDKFRKRARTERKPVIEDLFGLRDRALFDGYQPGHPNGDHRLPGKGRRVGVPRAMFFYDRFPFWRCYLERLGFEVVVSEPTNSCSSARGAELSVAEQCFPVQIAHGHVQELLDGTADRGLVDYVLAPNVVDMEAPVSTAPSQLCPWNQTLPYVLRAAPEFYEHSLKFLAPTVHFRLGREHVKQELAKYFSRVGVSLRQSDAAADSAYQAQEGFAQRLLQAGRQACARLHETGEPAVLLLGRPYNIYDRNSNCDIPHKLRDLYGVNVLPLDFLPLDEAPAEDLHPNMYWNSGRRILAAGRIARGRPKFHVIYITNFKCGPDSFIKHFLRDVTGTPFLTLQFDGHGNDAGYLTRCEAYLDSKGILRCSSSD
jgi:predicted CoA-substrate-specific enzyme activase